MKNLIDLKVEKIEKVYVGRNEGCRCGCKGKYTYTEDNEKKVVSILKKARSFVLAGIAEIDEENDTYINVVFGENKAMTFYKQK